MKGAHNAKALVYDGQVFNSLQQLARRLKTTPQRLRYYIKNDLPLNGNYIDYKI
jgi:hypothetical protein